MSRLSWAAAALPLLAACSFLNAPDDVSPGSTAAATSTGTGGSGGDPSATTSSSTGGSGGAGGGDGGAGGAPPPECGNGVLEAGEECDDDNDVAGDACSPTCLATEFDVEIDPSVGNEWPGVGLTQAGGDGSFLVVWRFLGASGNEIRGRAYTKEGLRVSQAPVKISTSTNPGQARIGTNASGRSLVAWQGFDDASAVKYRVIEPDGTPLGAADESLGGTAYSLITVGASDGGPLALSWLEPNTLGPGYLAMVRGFDSLGSPVASSTQLLGSTTTFSYPGVWGLGSGFVASYGTDDGKLGSFQLDPFGAPFGSMFSLAANANTNEDPLGVWVGPNQEFVAVYAQLVDLGGGLKHRISMRPFTAPGSSAVLDTLITVEDRDQYTPRVARHSSGRFVVAWSDYDPNVFDCDIKARVFEADGTPIATEFRVNQVTTGCQSWPGVAVNDAGDALFVWDNYDPTMQPRVSAMLLPRLLAD